MNIVIGKIKQEPTFLIKSIMKREAVSATKLASEMAISSQALRKRLRGGSKFSVDEFVDILNHLGYKIMIVKNEDVI